MDPNACLDRIIDAAIDGDVEELGYATNELAEWLLKGGAAPADPRR